MDEFPRKSLGLVAVAGAIATFATSLGDTFPRPFAWVSLAVAALFAAAAGSSYIISLNPARWRRRRPKRLWARITAGPLALDRKALIDGRKAPVSREDFKVVWQVWSDDLTAVMRTRGFPRERPRADGTNEGKLLRIYHRDFRNRALRHSDDASEQGFVRREYREGFYDPESVDDLWDIIHEVALRWVEPVSERRTTSA